MAISKFAKMLKDSKLFSKVAKSRKVGNNNRFAYNNKKLLVTLKPEQRGTIRCVVKHLGVSLHKIYNMVCAGLIMCNQRNQRTLGR